MCLISPVKEIVSDDFFTLSRQEYVVGFVIDAALYIINKNYNILCSSYSSIIVNEDYWDTNSIPFNLEKDVAMPVLINGNHCCFVLIKCQEKFF